MGWNGNYNIGDDAMTSVIIRYLIEHKIGNRFHFYADKSTLADYVDEDENIEIKGLPFYAFFHKIPYVRTLAAHHIFPHLFCNKKDILLIGGGSIIHRAKLSMLYIKIIKLVRQKNPKALIGAIGISVGPFTTEQDKMAAKLVLENMDFCAVRDSRSYNLVKEMNLKNSLICAPDLALLLPQLSNESFSKNGNFGNYIGMSLRSNYVNNEKIIWLSKLVQEILNRNPQYKLKLFNFCVLRGQSDMKDNTRLISSLPASFQKRIIIVDYSKNPLEFYKEIFSCDIMLCMRLHAAIISYTVNTKFAIISYHQKCIDFTEESGLPSEYILNETIPLGQTINTLQKLLDEKQTIFSKPRNEVIDKVRDHFSFIQYTNN